MRAMTSQITGVLVVCSTVCSGADKKNHQSSASLAFARGIHLFPFDDVIMWKRFHGMTSSRLTYVFDTIWRVGPRCKGWWPGSPRDTDIAHIRPWSNHLLQDNPHHWCNESTHETSLENEIISGNHFLYCIMHILKTDNTNTTDK